MTHTIRRRPGLGAWITAAALLAAVPGAAARPAAVHSGKPSGIGQAGKPTSTPPAPTAACSPPTVSQPFTSFGDTHHYTLAPGQTPLAFTGSGWTLTGGAKVLASSLYHGGHGTVLDLPAGSKAVSPVMCITNLDPTARLMVQNLAGSAGVDIKVTYVTRHGHTVSTGNVKGRRRAWSLSRTVRIHPSATSGWQLATFTLIPRADKHADYRIYDFYVDPRMVH
jgi:hypothetical protein